MLFKGTDSSFKQSLYTILVLQNDRETKLAAS